MSTHHGAVADHRLKFSICYFNHGSSLLSRLAYTCLGTYLAYLPTYVTLVRRVLVPGEARANDCCYPQRPSPNLDKIQPRQPSQNWRDEKMASLNQTSQPLSVAQRQHRRRNRSQPTTHNLDQHKRTIPHQNYPWLRPKLYHPPYHPTVFKYAPSNHLGQLWSPVVQLFVDGQPSSADNQDPTNAVAANKKGLTHCL